jgi:signal transduction histidine kinase
VRNDFLANISHELRTPLTAMQGFLEALQDGLVEEEDAKQKYLNVMYQETLHLNRLIDDLMMLIKLENQKLPLFMMPVDAAEVIDKVVFSFRQEAAGRNISIHVQLDDNLPKVFADKHRLIQILSNLLQNAIEFTQDGRIDVAAAAEGRQIRIDVTDTGIGIAEEDLKRIWERFFKSDRVRSRKGQGTGLGLAIVRELVEMHQGEISVNSQLGKGTTFSVWLPMADPHSFDSLTLQK